MTVFQLAALLAGLNPGMALMAAPEQINPISHRPTTSLDVTIDLRGKVCRTKSGATFSFSLNGRYAYDGLWQSLGTYELGEHSVVITFDSGLRRAFALSSRNGILYLEETAVTCSSG